jgi:hypothetical protein
VGLDGIHIRFDAPFGDERVPVEIYQAGTGDAFYVMVNRYFDGQIVWYTTGWRAWPSSKNTSLYGDDVFIIIDLIEEQFPPGTWKVKWLQQFPGPSPWSFKPLITSKLRFRI